MAVPTAEQHLRFLANLQRLLDEGAFVATYKFALLMALADLAVERGDDSNAPLTLHVRDIAEKFIAYYWRQSLPYPAAGRSPAVLKQNTGEQAAILKAIAAARKKYGGSLARARADARQWAVLVRAVATVVRVMPLWKLQTVGGEKVSFLYPNAGRGSTIELLPGVAAGFRKFHPLIRSVVQGEWIRQVRGIAANQPVLGQRAELGEFLFGSDRAPLNVYRPLLQDLQGDRCFYCRRRFTGGIDVDHFIPWSRYPVDLAHNFVLAHAGCNSRKKDYLAAAAHAERWVRRNREQAGSLAERFDRAGLFHDLNVSAQVARWAYGQAAEADADTWVSDHHFEKLPPGLFKSWS
ncbi:MAG: HNH endonuclease [Acidobacteria bacterium]|nr:HNH endonuclease [Acidobacteriota bacterium]